MLDQAENLRRLANKDNSKKKAKIITITSGKGGVGKFAFSVAFSFLTPVSLGFPPTFWTIYT